MKRIFVFLVPLLFTLSQNSFAQYVGPNAVVKTDLKQILADPVDDEYVKLKGYLIKKLSSDKYLFSDGAEQIRVEIDQFLFPTQPFDDKDLIEIEGEVEKDFLESAEIDVDRLTIVNP
ncbi:YgiW/YdeI family stress tolerance OB fold protein [Marinomonas algarum]|uniref:NirD/YgiW/YdeI family stress tolerance protein n=1 Tax=Marinomonas algarum TaxID=2883105 RepID=A0A9X1IMJ5_9GAMM|nr:NirD/YgiW/YdeI family stress tolerance protein [Marinomonas algarum]MCB5161915.1 NirD/YgiW/YdeI family stress tolerance protein [Marinomonas algarum]